MDIEKITALKNRLKAILGLTDVFEVDFFSNSSIDFLLSIYYMTDALV